MVLYIGASNRVYVEETGDDKMRYEDAIRFAGNEELRSLKVLERHSDFESALLEAKHYIDGATGLPETAIEIQNLRDMKMCPKCQSINCILDGSTIRKGGKIPAARCKKCGYRGPTMNFS